MEFFDLVDAIKKQVKQEVFDELERFIKDDSPYWNEYKEKITQKLKVKP